MLRPQKSRPRFIALCRSGSGMCSPIDLKSEMHGSAVGIENIDTRWVLSPIFEPAGALPTPAPEHRFWQVHFASQLAGVFECIAGAGDPLPCPSTILRMVPLQIGRAHV